MARLKNLKMPTNLLDQARAVSETLASENIGLQIRQIPLNSIEDSFLPSQEEKIRMAMEEISSHGLRSPLIVEQRESGIRVVRGGHYYLAAKRLGENDLKYKHKFSTLPCILRHYENDQVRRLDAGIGEEQETAGKEIEFALLEVDRIKTYPQSRGIAFEQLETEDIRQSVSQNGVYQPITVCPSLLDPGFFGVICGHRRLKATLENGLATIPAIIRHELQFGEEDHQETIDRFQIGENLQRQDLTPLQEALAIRKYKESYTLENTELSKRLGIKRTTAIDSLKIAKLSDFLRESVERSTGGGDEADEGVERSTPLPVLDAEEVAKARQLSRTHLLLLARHTEKAFFRGILLKCFEKRSTRFINTYVKAQKNKLERGPKKKSSARSLVESFYNDAIQNTANVKIDEATLMRLSEINPHELAAVLEEIRVKSIALNNLALSRLIPGKSFRVSVSIQIMDDGTIKESRSAGREGESKRHPTRETPEEKPAETASPPPPSEIESVDLQRFFQQRFWLHYPKRDGVRQGKQKAKQRFMDIFEKADGVELEQLFSALRKYGDSQNVRNGYAKDAVNWLNEWADWLPEIEAEPPPACPKCEDTGVYEAVVEGKRKAVICDCDKGKTK